MVYRSSGICRILPPMQTASEPLQKTLSLAANSTFTDELLALTNACANEASAWKGIDCAKRIDQRLANSTPERTGGITPPPDPLQVCMCSLAHPALLFQGEPGEVKKWKQSSRYLQNIHAPIDASLASPCPSTTSRSRFVEVEGGFVLPALATELGALLRHFIEVSLTFLFFLTHGLCRKILGVGVIKARGHDEPFYWVSRAVRLRFGNTLGFQRLAEPPAAFVPASPQRSQSAVKSGSAARNSPVFEARALLHCIVIRDVMSTFLHRFKLLQQHAHDYVRRPALSFSRHLSSPAPGACHASI